MRWNKSWNHVQISVNILVNGEAFQLFAESLTVVEKKKIYERRGPYYDQLNEHQANSKLRI